LTYGHPVSAYVPGHNLSHHKHTQSRKDVMRTSKARFRWNLLNGLLFMPIVGRDIFAADMRFFKAMYRRNPPWFRQMMFEAIVFVGSMGALIALDWRKFLLYVLIPHQYAAWGIITMNLLQHDGCDENSEYNHSRNFVGKLVNWFCYNNGYHTIHHMEAGLHWSLAPAEHQKRVAPFIHPNLDQPSLLAYLFRTYFWPGKRVTYEGKPLVLPRRAPTRSGSPRPKRRLRMSRSARSPDRLAALSVIAVGALLGCGGPTLRLSSNEFPRALAYELRVESAAPLRLDIALTLTGGARSLVATVPSAITSVEREDPEGPRPIAAIPAGSATASISARRPRPRTTPSRSPCAAAPISSRPRARGCSAPIRSRPARP
jgi:hypothetical protein